MVDLPADSEEGRAAAEHLLREWQGRAMLALFAYNRAANRAKSWDSRVGGAAAVLTAAIGTTVFATLQHEFSLGARIVVGAVSVTAAILAGIQAFAAFPQRIEDYENAARRYGAIRREIEAVRVSLPRDPARMSEEVERLREGLDQAAVDSPNAPRSIWEASRRHVKGEFTWAERLWARVRGLPPPRALGLGTDQPEMSGDARER